MSKFDLKILKKMKEKNINSENLDKNENQQSKAENQQNNNTEETNKSKDKTKKDSKDDKKTDSKKSETDKVESMGEKLQEMNDKYLRLYSEFENFRKRTSKEKLELISNAGERLIKELLPVLDDFDRALQSMAKSEDEQTKQTLEGITLIYKKFYTTLEREGLKPINAKDQVFDENLHEAIAQIPAPSEEMKGKVIDETTKGYYLNEKVIRYSKVVVAN